MDICSHTNNECVYIDRLWMIMMCQRRLIKYNQCTTLGVGGHMVLRQSMHVWGWGIWETHGLLHVAGNQNCSKQ